MSTTLKCRCGQTLSVPESAVGKRGKCPKCAATFLIPAPKTLTSPDIRNDGAGAVQARSDGLQVPAAAARAGANQRQDELVAAPPPPRWRLLQVIRSAFQSFTAHAVANSRPDLNNTCYKCDGLGLQFSPIDGKQSECEWCKGTGIVERYYADTADDIVQGGRRRWRRRW